MPRPRVLPAALLTVTAALAVAAVAPPAGAADLPVSQSRGFFLAGTVGGTDLGTLAKLQDAAAVNTGGASVTSANPLSATVLGQLTVPIGQQTVPIGQGLTFGVLNQYAQANPDGSAVASSGAIADNGAIQSPSAAGTAGNMSLNLQTLAASSGLPANLATALAALGNVTLNAGAIAGQANRAAFDPAGTLGQATGKYQIGSLTLTAQGGTAFTTLVDGLETGYDDAVAPLTRAIALLPGVSVTLPTSTDFVKALAVTGTGYSLDLATGTITLDLAALLKAAGTDINNLPPNTDLTPIILAALPNLATAIGTQLAANADNFFANTLGKVSITVLGQTTDLATFFNGTGGLFSFASVATAFATALNTLGTQFASGLGALGTALAQVAQIIVNGQATGTDGTFTETALSLRLLPSSGGALPTALQLDLGNAAVGPGAPLVVATPTPTTPVTGQPPMLANTGPFETLGGLAIGTWAVVAGIGMLFAAGAVRRSRLLHVGNHRH